MDDQAAILECRNGRTGAFRHLVERYQNQAFGHALTILGNAGDAEDAVQDAFIDAFRALRSFDAERRFYPWFYTLLRNRCLKSFRARRSDPVPLDGFDISEQGSEDSAQVRAALADLRPEDREILTLRHLDGLTYGELSARLGIPKGTVMSRLFYARVRLKESLKGTA